MQYECCLQAHIACLTLHLFRLDRISDYFLCSSGIRDCAILEILFASGIRRGELLPVQIEDVHFEKQLLRVNHGKGRKERIVPISQRASEWLAVYTRKVRPVISFVDSGNTLFLANNGKAYKPGKLSELTSRYIRLAGINLSFQLKGEVVLFHP